METPIKRESVDDIDELTTRLSRIPGPEYLSSRVVAGGKKAYYLSGEKSTQLANEVFQVNGWSDKIVNVTCSTMEDDNYVEATAQVTIAVTCLVPNENGQYATHEDVGGGFAKLPSRGSDAGRAKAEASSRAVKQAVTDGRKRALRQFGNATGLFLTDSEAVKACLREPRYIQVDMFALRLKYERQMDNFGSLPGA